MIRHLLSFVAVAFVGSGQTPDAFFRIGGADFRGTAPEQRLYWQSHLSHSSRRILQAADLAKAKAVATVLGSGVAIEIPLAELARRFDRLILVDMDGASLLESLDQVPQELRAKVELRVMDVTSFVTPLMEKLKDAVESSSTSEEAFRRYGAVFDNLALGQLVRLPPSDLVVSSLVLSEISRYPFGYAERLVRARFDAPLGAWKDSGKAFQKLVVLSIEDHARLLAALLADGGALYYSDTVARGPVNSRISAQARATVETAVLPEFRRLGLANSPADIGPALARLCEAEQVIKIEIQAFEGLLEAYRRTGEAVFDPLLPQAEVQRQFSLQGLSPGGAPEAWWWLSYPCAIAQNAGAFQVQSWILRRTAK